MKTLRILTVTQVRVLMCTSYS